MAIAALELHAGAVRAATNRLHVDRVIQLDRAGIAIAFFDGVEFGMIALKAADVIGEEGRGGFDGGADSRGIERRLDC